jgi:ADP-heptose:LPS heptosyltransferase
MVGRHGQTEAIMIVPARRIAVVRALQLGDMLVAVPALRALRAGYPDAEITLIGLPWAASFAARLDRYVNIFLPFPGWPGIDEVPYDKARTEQFIAEARAHDYDLVIQMHGSGGQSNPFALALGARVTAGYYDGPHPHPMRIGLSALRSRQPNRLSRARERGAMGKGSCSPSPTVRESRLGDKGIRLPSPAHGRGVGGEGVLWPAAPYPHDQPEVLHNLGLTTLLGCPDRDAALEFPLLSEDHAEADALLEPLFGDDRPLIGIHAGARPPARRWPPARFAAVADNLARRHDAHIILIGGPGEEETVAAVAERMSARALNLAGRTSLGGLAALLARLSLFIGNDSGPAHLAEAAGAPTVRLFGPADVDRWAPRDRTRHVVVRHPVACSPCGYWECPIDHRCLRRIDPADVTRAADGLLTPTKRGPSGGVGGSFIPVGHGTGRLQQMSTCPDGARREEPQRNHVREDICGA